MYNMSILLRRVQHAMYAERDIVLANPSVRPSVYLSVCPSVCLSHPGIVSKRMPISHPLLGA